MDSFCPLRPYHQEHLAKRQRDVFHRYTTIRGSEISLWENKNKRETVPGKRMNTELLWDTIFDLVFHCWFLFVELSKIKNTTEDETEDETDTTMREPVATSFQPLR